MGYIYLAVAIVSEIIGTSLLKNTMGFTKLIPVLEVLICYFICLFALSKAVNYLPLGVTYAIWGAVGIIAITGISIFVLKEPTNLPTLIGVGLIVIGTVLVNIFGTGH